MSSRLIMRSGMAVLALLALLTSVAQAGGWAVITLDELPTQLMAGQPVTIGFTVRQHGKTLRDDLTPIVRFDRLDARGSFTVTAERAGAGGHYVAQVTFPTQGRWNWKVDIEQFGMVTQPLPPLNVQPGPAAAINTNTAETASANRPFLLGAGIVGLAGALGCFFYWLRSRKRAAVTMCVIFGIAGAIGLVATGSHTGAIAAQPAEASLDQAALGERLFLAKGCAMCHMHEAVKASVADYVSVEIGPNLTHHPLTADYLRSWLANPKAIKPETEMPNLGLKQNEIEALVAFLTSNQ